MSDHSTGSSASSTNSWTILSPEEATVETVGPEDGTESLSGVPGLPEEGTGVLMESDVSVTDAIAEPVLSEEGHQVCQETSPVVCEAAAFVGPSFSGFDDEEFDPEIHAPIIHDTITSSPPDSDLLGSTPFAMTSEASMLFSEEPSFVPPSSGMFTDIGYGHETPMEEILAQECRTPEVLSEESMSPEESHTPEPFPQQSSAPEGLLRQSPSPEGLPEESPAPEDVALETVTPETLSPESSASEVPLDRTPTPDIPLPDILEASAPEVLTQESSASEPQSERSPTQEPVPIEVTPDVISTTAPAPEVVKNLSLSTQGSPPAADTAPTPDPRPDEGSPAPVSLEPETITSASAQQEHEEEEEEEEEQQEEPSLEEEVVEVPVRVEPVEAEPVEEVVGTDPGAEGDGLRLRHTMPLGRSSEDEEEDEEEFQLAERREDKQGFSLNKLIVGALVLLCLGSLFFSDDGFDGSEMTEQELLERLAQENQQITTLEAQLQTQKEALDQAIQAATEKEEAGGEALQTENAKLKDDLSAMPGLREELESLRARVAELSQLTVRESETTPTSTDTVTPPDKTETANRIPAVPEQGAEQQGDRGDGLKVALQRQKSLLEDSRKRLEGMKKSVGKKKGVREGLVEMQKRLSEQAERLGKRHDWKRKQHENDSKKDQGRKWAGKKEQGNKWEDKSKHSSQWEESKKEHHGQKNGKKEHGNKWNGKKDHGEQKHQKESEKCRGEEDWKHGKDEKDGKEGEHSKQRAWKKYHEDWDGGKQDRKVQRENRKSFMKSSSHHDNHHHHHHHHHHHQQEHHSHEKQNGHTHEHVDFWKHQLQKLGRNPGPAQACSGATQCAKAEGLVAVDLLEFQDLLEGYLSELPASISKNKEELQRLTDGFFSDGVFDHERLLFSVFAEDVADILEDLVDVLDNESLEEKMEEFEREALWKFAAGRFFCDE